tara:strand:- start:221 stop:613 length:393 start_codon:yes stop_codon:yes gene_type:complete
MSKRGILRGSLSSIGKYISSTFDELRKNISTFISNVLPSAPKNSGSKTPRQQSSHKADSNPPIKTHGKVKSLIHNEEAGRRAEDQGREAGKQFVELLHRVVNKSEKTKPRRSNGRQSRQSSLPRGRGGIL